MVETGTMEGMRARKEGSVQDGVGDGGERRLKRPEEAKMETCTYVCACASHMCTLASTHFVSLEICFEN